MSKSALGRGLGALLGGAPKPSTPAGSTPPASTATSAAAQDSSRVTANAGPRFVPVQSIRPSPLQPRKHFTEENLRELADSLRAQGVIQPLLVRRHQDYFELIAGERRWRAAQIAGLVELPILERNATDREVLELALIENLQRENLNPIEEALGYAQLGEQFQLKQEEIAQRVGKNRASVANALRLLKLPEPLREAIRQNSLSVGHAKVILGINDPARQIAAADRVQSQKLSVRQLEELIAQWVATVADKKNITTGTTAGLSTRDPHVVDLENKLRERFGTKASLRYRQGRGSIELRFYNDDDLDRILQIAGIVVD